jgi:hypothetical protein
MTVQEIVSKYLEDNGYDGLFSVEGDGCACRRDALMPCKCEWEPLTDCEAGYLRPCPKECREHDFHIGPSRETA